MAKGTRKKQKPARKKQNRRTLRQLLLDALTELSKGDNKPIGNITLRETLRWDEDRYWRVRDQLVEEGKIVRRSGKGGSVALAHPAGASPLSVFISYCHADVELKNQLLKHLKPLERLSLVSTWHDGLIKAGDEWEKSISSKLATADLILLLISVDFLNSKFCYDVELEKAMERNEHGEARVLPVILRNCMWKHSPFAKLQALPKDGKPCKSWEHDDDAFVDVAEGVKSVAEELIRAK